MCAEVWKKDPLELLEHGKSHIMIGSDFDLRIAMISIDNAMEVAIKTYLNQNKRI